MQSANSGGAMRRQQPVQTRCQLFGVLDRHSQTSSHGKHFLRPLVKSQHLDQVLFFVDQCAASKEAGRIQGG